MPAVVYGLEQTDICLLRLDDPDVNFYHERFWGGGKFDTHRTWLACLWVMGRFRYTTINDSIILLILCIIYGPLKMTTLWFMNSCKWFLALRCLFDFISIRLGAIHCLGKRDIVWVYLAFLLVMDRGYQSMTGDVFNIMAVKKIDWHFWQV